MKAAVAISSTVMLAYAISLRFMTALDIVLLVAVLLLLCGSVIGLVTLIHRMARKRWPALPSVLRVALIANAVLQLAVLITIHSVRRQGSVDRDELIDDIAYLVSTIEEVHPQPYHFFSQAAFRDSIEALTARLPPTIDEGAAFRQLAALMALLRDGHTQMRYEAMGMKLLFGQLLPYAFDMRGNRLLIQDCLIGSCGIPDGAEVLEFAGNPVEEVLADARKYVPHDSDFHLENSLISELCLFLAIRHDFAPIEVLYRAGDGAAPQTHREKLSLMDKLRLLEALGGEGLSDPYTFEVVEDGIGYVDFRSFRDRDRFRLFTEATFTAIAEEGVSDLIIDIRDNLGGHSSLGDDLLQYISSVPYTQFDSVLVKVSTASIEMGGLDDKNDIDSSITYRAKLKPLTNNPLRFTGRVYLLTSRRTYSSATSFSAAFTCYDVGTMIGEETAGLSVSYGDQLDFTMPRTQFPFAVSYKQFFRACGQADGRGVRPDHDIQASEAMDVARAMARTLAAEKDGGRQ